MAKGVDFLEELGQTFADKFKKANLHEISTTILKEGLYIGLMFNLWYVTKRVPVDSFWGSQRDVMRQMLSAMATAFNTEIPLIKWKPFEWGYRFVRTWEDALKKSHTTQGYLVENTELVDGVLWYKPVAMPLRVLMVLMFPGLLRLFVNLTRQLVQIVR